MRQKVLGCTAATLGILAAINAIAIVTDHADPDRWGSVLRVLTCAGIAATVLSGLDHIATAMRTIATNQRLAAEKSAAAAQAVNRLSDTLQEICLHDQHRASFLRGQVSVLIHQVEPLRPGFPFNPASSQS